ncbi:nucleotidyltransferase domain-containing protein [Olsenella uli]|uniref:nucleotidyltransferase domain-containing protein n=1 Tax=Olsenella uli TaxID=133926 RepID=UPI00195A7454|nr:nucleotidyltransferase domain-containing protein [Olsenella uli]
MPNLGNIQRAVRRIAAEHGLDKVTLFGSYARGKAREGSDVDLVVEASRPLGFARGAIYRELEEALGCPVDVIFGERSLYPFVRPAVASEGVVLYEA